MYDERRIRKETPIEMPASIAESISSLFSVYRNSPVNAHSEYRTASNVYKLSCHTSGKDSLLTLSVLTMTPESCDEVLYLTFLSNMVYIPPVGEVDGTLTVTGSRMTVSIPVTADDGVAR